MATVADIKAKIGVEPTVESPKVTWGPSSWLGLIFTIVPLVGAVFAAVESNDTATVVSGTSALLVALVTIGGRMAQAVAIAKQVAVFASPFVEALAKMPSTEAQAPPPVVVNNIPAPAGDVNVPPPAAAALEDDIEDSEIEDEEVDAIGDSDLPSDEEEFANPPADMEVPESASKPDLR